MANARLASLLEQRKSLYNPYGSNRIRVLSPSNNSLSTIAKKTASNELEAMYQKYKDGLVGNEEMKTFLLQMKNNPLIPVSEKTDIDSNLNNFDYLIQKDKLEASFKATPDNSYQQVQAAQALANFYRARAATMETGTPAQSAMLESAASWDQKGTSITQNVAQVQRQNKRYLLEQQVNSLPSNSSDKLTQRADMWNQLYQQAITDGDTTDANKFASYYQRDITLAQETAVKENEQVAKVKQKQSRDLILNAFGELENLYHDNKINEQQYLETLAQIQGKVDETGDYGLIHRFDTTVDKVQKALDKGGVNRGTTANGLPVVLKGYKGTGVGIGTDWDLADFNYSDDLRKFNQALQKGYDEAGNPYTKSDYFQDIGHTILTRMPFLKDKIDTVYRIASQNPDTKIDYNGKKVRAEEVLKSLQEEYDSVNEQAGAVNNGNFALMEVAPKSGSELGKGKSFVTYKLVNPNSIEPGTAIQDETGVFHELTQKEMILPQSEMKNVSNGVWYDPQNPQHMEQVTQDKNGRMIIRPAGQQTYRVYTDTNPDSRTNLTYREFDYNPNIKVQSKESLEQAQWQAERANESKAILDKAKKISDERLAIEKNLQNSTIVNPVSSAKVKALNTQEINTLAPALGPVGQGTGVKVDTTNLPKATQPAVIKPATVIPTKTNSLTPTIAPNNNVPGSATIKPATQPITAKPIGPVGQGTGTTINTSVLPKISNPNITQPYKVISQPAPSKPAQNNQGGILNTVKNLATKIFSFWK